MKDVVPVPPPRRKKRNRGSRSLPIPKPDGTRPESGNFGSSEPLCSPTTGDGDVETWKAAGRICGTEDARHEGRRTKEIYEHKVSRMRILLRSRPGRKLSVRDNVRSVNSRSRRRRLRGPYVFPRDCVTLIARQWSFFFPPR